MAFIHGGCQRSIFSPQPKMRNVYMFFFPVFYPFQIQKHQCNGFKLLCFRKLETAHGHRSRNAHGSLFRNTNGKNKNGVATAKMCGCKRLSALFIMSEFTLFNSNFRLFNHLKFAMCIGMVYGGGACTAPAGSTRQFCCKCLV